MICTEVITEDGATLHPGDRAFNYYDMKAGTIGDDLDDSGWFTFVHDDGTDAVLNGARICTTAYAERKGWPGRGVIGI